MDYSMIWYDIVHVMWSTYTAPYYHITSTSTAVVTHVCVLSIHPPPLYTITIAIHDDDDDEYMQNAFL